MLFYGLYHIPYRVLRIKCENDNDMTHTPCYNYFMNRPKFEKRELYTMLLILFAALLICYILLIALGELPMPIIGDLDAQQTPTEQPTNQPTDEPDPQTTDFSTPYFTPSVILQPSNDPSKLLQVYFIDVGQGDCAILISPNGETMLIDGGELGNYDTISGYLDELDIDDIDVMVATHAHSDHIGSLGTIADNYAVETFYTTKYDSSSKTYENMMESLRENGAEIKHISAELDTYIPWDDDITVRVMSPIKGIKYSDLNDSSLVLKITYGTQSLMMTGDLGESAESIMVDTYSNSDLQSTVLKVSHHGSETSSSQEFINAVSPQIAIISVGEGNKYGHPRPETLKRFKLRSIELFRTDKLGSILVSFTEDSYTLKPHV